MEDLRILYCNNSVPIVETLQSKRPQSDKLPSPQSIVVQF